MPVQIGAKPDSGFDDPIGMLKDCHRRVERFLGILCLVASRARGRVLDSEERSAVESALHYFAESGPRHNMDEEESLFPRLRNMNSTAVPPQVLVEVQRLESEHRHAAALHDETTRLYSKWIAESSLADPEISRLISITTELRELYRDHIQTEEEVVFPFAASQIDLNTLAEIGFEFRVRRK